MLRRKARRLGAVGGWEGESMVTLPANEDRHGEMHDISLYVRPLGIAILSAIVLATYHGPLPKEWDLTGTSLDLEQCLALLLFGWSLTNCSLLAWTSGSRPSRLAAIAGMMVDVAFLTVCMVVSNGQKSPFALLLLFVIVASSRAMRSGLVVLAVLLAAGGYFLAPIMQATLGKNQTWGSNSEQISFVLLQLFAGVLVFRYASLPETVRSPSPRPNRILLALAVGLPCLQLGFLDVWIGLAAVIPAAIALRLAVARTGNLYRLFAHLVAWLCGCAGIVASLLTVRTGILIVDAFVPRLMEKLTRQFPRLGDPWVLWVASFVLIFLAVEMARRAIFPASRRDETPVTA